MPKVLAGLPPIAARLAAGAAGEARRGRLRRRGRPVHGRVTAVCPGGVSS